MARHVVASLAELPPGSRKIVEVAGRSIGVFNVGGELFALRNRCPHQGGPLCEGRLAGQVEVAAPGDEIQYSRPGEILRCPWHGWEYDIETGICAADRRIRLRRYEAVEREGAIYVAG